jgi:uncharacterized metal-binding protein YceD (DUF177 family)
MSPPPSIRVDTIPEEGLPLELSLDDAWLAQVLTDANMRVTPATHGAARIRLDRADDDVIVSGTVKSVVTAECVACLEDVSLPVEAEFTLVLSPAASQKARRPNEEVELTSDELDTDLFENDTVDLSHWLREQLMLAAPLHPRHEGDCPRPLTPPNVPTVNGGLEREIDPRLAPLMKLAKKE